MPLDVTCLMQLGAREAFAGLWSRAGRKRTRQLLIRPAALAIALSTVGPPTVAALPPVVPETCVGDQDDDGVVSLAELVRGIGIALGDGSDFCAVYDANRTGQVDVGDLIAAVSDSLHGCGALRRADLSGFQRFRFERQRALGFCPPLGTGDRDVGASGTTWRNRPDQLVPLAPTSLRFPVERLRERSALSARVVLRHRHSGGSRWSQWGRRRASTRRVSCPHQSVTEVVDAPDRSDVRATIVDTPDEPS